MATHKYEQKILYRTIKDIFNMIMKLMQSYQEVTIAAQLSIMPIQVIRLLCFKISNNAISKDDFLHKLWLINFFLLQYERHND